MVTGEPLFATILLLGLELVGLIILTYSSLQLSGIDPLYVALLAFSKREKAKRRELQELLEKLVDERLRLVASVLGVQPPPFTPRVKLSYRRSKKPGGKYLYKSKTIVLDVADKEDLIPVLDHELTHFIQDVALGLGPHPKWLIEGMASYVELALHGRVRGYYDELQVFLTQRATASPVQSTRWA